MSSPARSRRSDDLARLRQEGYDIAVEAGALHVRRVPYVTCRREVQLGTLVVPLRMSADVTVPPTEHHVRWIGGTPHSATGEGLVGVNASEYGVPGQLFLCHRPFDREFRDYHELVTSYVNLMGRQAVLIEPTSTARVEGRVIEDHNEGSPFHYVDTASSRAGTEDLSRRLEGQTIAIVGLGGTGSYVLDLVSKSPVRSIHLFDDDTFDQHNAFRAPGAASLDDLRLRRAKVDHFAAVYSRMHRGIVAHRGRVQQGSLSALDRMDFVFLCIDEVGSKKAICNRLARAGVPFIDAGIGLEVSSEGIFGLVRTTTSTQETRALARECIPGAGGGTDDPYRTNVQVADLNALNAALAVTRWKRHLGFYRDGGGEHQSVFDVESGRVHTADNRRGASSMLDASRGAATRS